MGERITLAPFDRSRLEEGRRKAEGTSSLLLLHTPPLSWHPSKEGTRYTRPKAYHSVDDDGYRDVSPLDFLNPLQRGTPPGGGYV